MIFVEFHAPISMNDLLAQWNSGLAPEEHRARLLSNRVAVDERVGITAQSNPNEFLVEADRLYDELLIIREMASMSGARAYLYLVEDAASLWVHPGETTADALSALLPKADFLAAAFSRIGKAQLQEPDVFAFDILLDWAAKTLKAAGHTNHLGFASFARHRLVVHAPPKTVPFATFDAETTGIIAQTSTHVVNYVALAHPKFAVVIAGGEPLEDGTEGYLGYIFFYDQPEWPQMPAADQADQKLVLAKSLCTERTPWIVSDIRDRTTNVREMGGAWLDTFVWEGGTVIENQEFVEAPDN